MQKRKMVRNNKGFTLIELMVAMVVLAIITAIAIPIYAGFRQDAVAQEAYESLSTWGEAVVGRAAKPTWSAPAVPTNTANFTYAVVCAANGNCTCTATGVGADVAGQALTLAVNGTLALPTKVFGGTL